MQPQASMKSGGMVMDLRVGESITFEPADGLPKIVLTIEAKTGQRARVRVQTDPTVKVSRPEKTK